MLFADNSSAVWISKSSSRWIWDVAQIGTVVTSTKDKAWKWRYSLQNCCKLATLSFAQASKVKLIQNTTYMPCCFFVPVSTSFFLNNIQCDSREEKLSPFARVSISYIYLCSSLHVRRNEENEHFCSTIRTRIRDCQLPNGIRSIAEFKRLRKSVNARRHSFPWK